MKTLFRKYQFLIVSAIARVTMYVFGSKTKREIWTETMIRLYERQIAAREAMGNKYCCHPSKNASRINRFILRVVK